MKPAFSIGSVELSTYALLLSIGACVGFWLTYRESLRKRLDAGKVLELAALAFASGLVGARGLSWILQPELYAGSRWWSVFLVWDRGGMSIYGGLALAALLGLVWIRRQRLPAWEVADTLVVSWAPFLGLVRIGCFLNGCCYGKPTASPLGLVAGGSPNNVSFGIPSHPTQLYASAAAFGLFLLLWTMRSRRRFAGQLTVVFLLLYSAFRLFNDSLRGDTRTVWSPGDLGPFGLNQLLSFALAVFAIVAGLLLRQPRGRRSRMSNPAATASGRR